MESVLYAYDIRSRQTADMTRVPAQKVHNYRSDRWITLNFFFTSFRRLFYMEKPGIGTPCRGRLVGPYRRHDKSTGSKGP